MHNPCALMVEINVNWCSHCEKQYEDSSKAKIKLLHDPGISPQYFSEENENINSKRHMHCCGLLYRIQNVLR